MIRLGTLIFLLFVLAATASAQTPSLDRFLEDAEAGDYQAAEKAWEALERSGPQPVSVELRHATVLLHIGRAAEARATLEDVLEREPRNVLALTTLARLRAAESGESAKTLLLAAAREGYPVLREIATQKELRALHDDPAFVLAAMRAAGQFDASHETGRNPFARPRLPSDPEPPRKPAIVKPAAHEPGRRLADWIDQAQKLLRAMSDAVRDERLPEEAVAFSDLKGLCEEMRREPEEDFARAADAILARAKALDQKAQRLARLKSLAIEVTGIVVAPSGATSRAIISVEARGAIYEVGDDLRDARGERVRGLKVASIVEGSVTLEWDGERFVRELRRSR